MVTGGRWDDGSTRVLYRSSCLSWDKTTAWGEHPWDQPGKPRYQTKVTMLLRIMSAHSPIFVVSRYMVTLNVMALAVFGRHGSILLHRFQRDQDPKITRLIRLWILVSLAVSVSRTSICRSGRLPVLGATIVDGPGAIKTQPSHRSWQLRVAWHYNH